MHKLLKPGKPQLSYNMEVMIPTLYGFSFIPLNQQVFAVHPAFTGLGAGDAVRINRRGPCPQGAWSLVPAIDWI